MRNARKFGMHYAHYDAKLRLNYVYNDKIDNIIHALCMHNAHKVFSFSAKEAVGSRYTFFFRDVLLAYL